MLCLDGWKLSDGCLGVSGAHGSCLKGEGNLDYALGVSITNQLIKVACGPVYSSFVFSPSTVQLGKSPKTIKIFRPLVRG